jgi:serine/threonine protein kinase
MAPEQFSKQSYDPVKAEIYALGMFFFHFLFKAFPFETNAGSDPAAKSTDFIYSFEHSAKNRHNIKVSRSFLDLLAMMMKYNPSERATIDEVLNSQWIRDSHQILVSNPNAQAIVRQ